MSQTFINVMRVLIAIMYIIFIYSLYLAFVKHIIIARRNYKYIMKEYSPLSVSMCTISTWGYSELAIPESSYNKYYLLFFDDKLTLIPIDAYGLLEVKVTSVQSCFIESHGFTLWFNGEKSVFFNMKPNDDECLAFNKRASQSFSYRKYLSSKFHIDNAYTVI